jgi:hypothetical protein
MFDIHRKNGSNWIYSEKWREDYVDIRRFDPFFTINPYENHRI